MIYINSSSYILPNSSSWDKIKKKWDISFSNYGLLNVHYKKNYEKKNIFIFIIFLNDIIDFNDNKSLKNYKNKIKVIIKNIKRQLQLNSGKVIVYISEFYFNTVFNNLQTLSYERKIKNYFLDEIYKISNSNLNLKIIDLDYLFALTGINKCFDNRNYNYFSCRMSLDGLNILTSNINDILNLLFYHKRKKVLILDCDNTLWGGVVGDDGYENLAIGQDGIGKAYLNFQKTIKKISDTGIILALSSKNNEDSVREVFLKNKNMELKINDITSFRVNWKEKSKNIISLSNDLMLGLDSFVFWDDNPIERDKIKKTLKDVTVIDPSDQVSDWAKQLLEYKGFFYTSLTKEDLKKKYQYQNREKFISNKKIFDDELEYLRSIKIKLNISKINKTNLLRAHQMTEKINQFNLNGDKIDIHDLKKYSSKNKFSYMIKLKDIYGDHGEVLFVYGDKHAEYLVVKNFLMSCRILGRYLEFYILKFLQNFAKKQNLSSVLFPLKITKKNQLIKSFLDDAKLNNLSKKSKIFNNLNKKFNFDILYELKINQKIRNLKKIYE